MAVTIVWSAVVEGFEKPCVRRRSTQILSVLPPSGDEAAAKVLGWWLEEEEDGFGNESNWQVEIGDDTTEVSAHVMIHEPADLAGLYAVELERKIVARGYDVADCDAEEARALLSAVTEEAA